MRTTQKHIRTLVDVNGEECIEKISFYPSNFPSCPKGLEEILKIEFPLLHEGDFSIEKQSSGVVDVIPKTPQPRPEDFVHFDELTIFHCDRPSSVESFLEIIHAHFYGLSLKDLSVSFGIASITIAKK